MRPLQQILLKSVFLAQLIDPINREHFETISPYCQQDTYLYCSQELLLVAELHKISHKLTTHNHHIMHTH